MRCSTTLGLAAVLGAAIIGTASADLVDAREKGAVILNEFPQNPTPFDTRTEPPVGCDPVGCIPGNIRDLEISFNSRWSCTYELLDKECFVDFEFDPPQVIKGLNVAFHKGDERTRSFLVEHNDGDFVGTFTASGDTLDFEYFEFDFDSVAFTNLEFTTITIKPVGLDDDEWFSISEIEFLVEDV